MASIRQIVDELRRRGVTVHEWPGWDGRGNSDGGTGPAVRYIDVVGAVIHHTASDYGSAYDSLASSTRPDLRGGAVCNFAGNDDGSLTVIASGLAWHAGPGVGPDLGPVLGAVPGIRNAMNRVTAGLEIIYPGDAPMRPAQYETACVFAKVVADLCAGGDTECVRAHAETNGNVPGGSGKWDPGHATGQTIDMAAFRRDAAANGTTQEDFMATMSDTEKAEVLDFVRRGPIYIWNDQNANPLILERNGGKPRDARSVQGDIYVHTVALLQQVAGLTAAVNVLAAGAAGAGTTAEELRTVIREEMAKAIDVQVTVTGAKNATA